MAANSKSNVILQCEDCSYRYHTKKNKKTTPQKLSFNKYCPECRKHKKFTEKK